VPFSSLIDAYRHHVQVRAEHTAVVVDSDDGSKREISWHELGATVDFACRRLLKQFQADPSLPRHLGHASDNSLADIVIALASMSLGTIEFPFDHRLDFEEIGRRWNSIGGLWVDAALRNELADVKTTPIDCPNRIEPVPGDPDAPSLVLWTSGTTGTPRGVTLSSRNLAGNAAAKLKAVPQSISDRRLCVLPLSHAYARTCDFGTWLLSGCVLGPTLGYAGLKRSAIGLRPTLINVVPSIAYRMLEDETLRGLDDLRLLGCGGAAISEAAFELWRKRGVTVIQGYGLTETSPVICSATPENATAGCVGDFVDGWESKIVDQQLFVRGPHVMHGYWDDPSATSDRIDADGWMATGDQVEIDPSHGQLRILGRVDDVIVLDSARKIHPAVVERQVERVPSVHHAMLVKREQLEIWLDHDADRDFEQIQKEVSGLLESLPEGRRISIYRFEPPLDLAGGELTTKGTIRRRQIMVNRFSDQAGS
jgi:long-chain acyl-CoA synthetase